jgi:transposase
MHVSARRLNNEHPVLADGRPIRFFMTAGEDSDYTGGGALLDSLPKVEWLLPDRGHDADWFRDALKDRGVKPCIPGRSSRQALLARQVPLQTPQEDRDQVLPVEGLATRRNPLRQMPEGLLLRRRSRRNRHVLAMNPDRALTQKDPHPAQSDNVR